MNEILTEWVGPLLLCLAVLVAGAGIMIYIVQICPGVKAHTFLTKLICPYFILSEFRKTSRDAGTPMSPYYAYWCCFAAPLFLVLIYMFCSTGK